MPDGGNREQAFHYPAFSLAFGLLAAALRPEQGRPCPAEVETRVTVPLEKRMWEIPGVEYVYSVSSRDMAVVTVRFYVGEDRERSLVKLHNRITSHIDEAPPGVAGWLIKPVEIDDVPIVTVAMYSKVSAPVTPGQNGLSATKLLFQFGIGS